MCAHLLLLRAAKLQLAVEQPLTEGLWNPLKKDTPIQRQRRSHSKMVGGCSQDQIKSHTSWMGDPQTGE